MHDAFPFGSRSIPMREVPAAIRPPGAASAACAPSELLDETAAASARRLAAAEAEGGGAAERGRAEAYNLFASEHEHVRRGHS